jgi:hypothetical protein
VVACAAAITVILVLARTSGGFVIVGRTPTGVPNNVPFSRSGPWRTPIPSSARPASDSHAIVANLAKQVSSYYGHVALNTVSYSTTLYTVGPNRPEKQIAFDDCHGETSPPGHLARVLSRVPVPTGAVGSEGEDEETSIYQPSSNRLWEFWKFQRGHDGRYSACWGGEIDDVSRNPGIFPTGYGATASGLPLAGFVVRISELQDHQINHTLGLEVVRARRGIFSWPANRTDGYDSNPTDPVEGERFRLNPKLNLTKLHLNPVALTLARAMQRYGLIVTDQSGSVAIQSEDPRPYESEHHGTNPYTQMQHGTPTFELLDAIPWNQLQAMPLNYGKP